MGPMASAGATDAVGRSSRSLRSSISSLDERNYRFYFVGQVVSSAGTWMQTVAQSFLVLDLTHSGTDLGLATAARFVPIFALGPAGGVVADRFDKRRLMALTQAAAGLLAATFAVLITTGEIRMWMIYVLAAALGLVNVVDKPAGQSFIAEMVRREHLKSAVMLASMTSSIARVFGAALGGLFVAVFGETTCFTLNALSYGAVLVSLVLMRQSELRPSEPVTRRKGQVREGLRYVAVRSELAVPLVMIAIIGTMAWEYQVSLPIVARSSFHGGAGLYGLMTSILGVGSVAGGFPTATRRELHAVGLSVSAVAWGVTMLGAAAAPDLTLELVALFAVGFASIAFNVTARAALQLAASPEMRGRMMALWSVAWLGSTVVGGPVVGWVGQHFGGRWSLVVGAVPTLLCGLLALPSLRAVDARSRREPGTERSTGQPRPVTPQLPPYRGG